MTATANDPATWRDPALGEAKILELPAGRLRYHDVGEGPTLVFVHGLLVNANLWRKVVSRLSPDFRCVVLDLPVGSHIVTREPAADNGPLAVVEMIGDAIEALGLEDVTLIGNDSGGAMSQVLVTNRPERIGRLVLTSCDFRDNFPPKMFSYFKVTIAVPGGLWVLAQSMRVRAVRRLPIAFGWLAKKGIDRAAEDSYVLPVIQSSEVRRDTHAFIAGADTAITNAAADRLGEFSKPALIAWSADDKVFPRSDAVALAAALPGSRLEWIDDAYTFSMEDNPARLADLIHDFAGSAPS